MNSEKVQLVYVLTSDSSDIYYEQTLISAWSAKYFNPTLKIVLVLDERTRNSLNESRNGLFSIVDDVKVIKIPRDFCDNKVLVSRYLRTNVRHFLEGSILVIDTDTIVVDSLDEIINVDGDICAVFDGHQKNSTSKSGSVYEQRKILGLPAKCTNYYNGGVLFVRDSEIAKKFYSKWFDNWEKCAKKGIYFDQSPLYKTNSDMHVMKEMSGIWNCQCPMIDSYPFLKKSKILHVFNYTERVYAYDWLLQKVKVSGTLSLDEKKEILDIKSKLMKNVDFEFSHTSAYSVLKSIFLRSRALFNFINSVCLFLRRLKQ